jgi:hypothetical protein
MAFDIGAVTAKVNADITNFKAGMQEAKSEVSGFGDHVKKMGDGIADFGKKAAIFTGIATAAIVAFGKSSIDSYNESEKQYAQLSAVIKSTGGIAGVTAKQAIDLAAAFQKTTTFSDEATLSAENLLLTFTNITKDIFPQATETVLNMSQALGQDTKSSAIQLGKALQDPILGVTALRRVGVNFNEAQADVIKNLVETGKSAEAQKMILKELATEFGGSASAAAQTFAGKIEILKNRFDDFKETVGGILVSISMFAVEGNAGNLTDALNEFIPNAGLVDNIVNALVKMRDIFVSISNWVIANQESVITFLKGFAIAIGALMIIGTITGLIMALTNPIFILVAVITALYYAWQTNFLGLQTITTAVITYLVDFWNNYLLPAIAAVTAFFIANWGQISAYLNAVWQIIIGIIQIAWGIVSGILKVGLAVLSGNWSAAWEAIKQSFANIWEGIKNIFNGAFFFIKDWGGKVLGALVSPFEQAWGRIQDLVNKIKNALDFTQRHSPSVIDIINTGVKLANRALENLSWNADITPNYAAASIMNGAQNSNINQISISLAGAYIGSEFAAQSIGEKIGDSIIRKLQQNVKF